MTGHVFCWRCRIRIAFARLEHRLLDLRGIVLIGGSKLPLCSRFLPPGSHFLSCNKNDPK